MRSMISRKTRFSSRASYIGFTRGFQASRASLRCFWPLPSPKGLGQDSSPQDSSSLPSQWVHTGRIMSANWAVSENLISKDTQVSAARITLMAVDRLPRVCIKFEFVCTSRRGFTGISRASW